LRDDCFGFAVLTALGTATLVFITVKFYWGERRATAVERRGSASEGKPSCAPARLKTLQKNPRKTRKSSFGTTAKFIKMILSG